MQQISRQLDIKSMNQEGVFTGYASVFDVVDDHHEMIAPGAFSETLQCWRQKGQWPKLLWQHNQQFPIGLWHHIQEDEHGLFVKGQLLLDLHQAKEAYTLMKANVVDGLSIGFKTRKSTPLQRGRLRVLQAVDLYEISLVTFAANPAAKVVSMKSSSLDAALLMRLDDLGQLFRR
jgi:uncharacterized protein